MTEIESIIGVYDADGGLRGELSYLVGKSLGQVHCALCDITHSPVRRKRAWDAMVARLGVPFELFHRNEIAVEQVPAVYAVLADGTRRLLLGPAELESVDGSVEAFEPALREALAR